MLLHNYKKKKENLLSRYLVSGHDNSKHVFPPFFHIKGICFLCSLQTVTLAISCTKTKNVMKEENVIVKMITAQNI